MFRLEVAAGMALIAGLFLVSLLYVTQPRRSKLPRQVATQNAANGIAPQPLARQPPSDTVHYIGLAGGGCATSNCHGGLKDDTSAWKTSAFVFQGSDPHAQAFHVLLEERSQEIVKRLAAGENSLTEKMVDPAWYLQQLEAKCIRCHATPLPDNPAASADANRTDFAYEHYSQGVSCEACHGPASLWRDAHLNVSWGTNRPEGTVSALDKSALGFQELEKPNIAAAVCAGCHIGAGGDERNLSTSQQEVTHDLIAAGHPRLDFEFSAWYAALPPHWDRARETQPDFYVKAWAHGQAKALQARCRLIENQRRRWANANNTPSSSAWPEFAHYDCYGCHQGLTLPPHNAETLDVSAVSPLAVSGSWDIFAQFNQPKTTSALAWMTNALDSVPGPATSGSRTKSPPPWADLSAPLGFSRRQLAEVLAAYPDSVGQDEKAMSWDALTSWYYAAAAIVRDADRHHENAGYNNAVLNLKNSLNRLAYVLEQSLIRDADGMAAESRYASPRGIHKIEVDGPKEREKDNVREAFLQARQAMRELRTMIVSADETP
jgi:hypothetical protein